MIKTTVQLFSYLAEDLVMRFRQVQTFLVGIDGRAGVGKSTFAANLADALKQIGQPPTLMYFDDFWKPSRRHPTYFRNTDLEITGNDYDYDWLRFRDQVLFPLRENRPAKFQRYDRKKEELTEWCGISPGGVVIVEGFSSTRNELASYYHFRIFVQAPRDVCFARATERDGKAFRGWYKIYWMPEEDHYVNVHCPETTADLVVDASGKQDYDRKLKFFA